MRFFRKEGTGGTNCRFTFYREQSNKITAANIAIIAEIFKSHLLNKNSPNYLIQSFHTFKDENIHQTVYF